MARFKDFNWELPHVLGKPENAPDWDTVKIAVFMDLRDELRGIRRAVESMNRTLQCRNFQQIPETLKAIQRSKCHRKHSARKGA